MWHRPLSQHELTAPLLPAVLQIPGLQEQASRPPAQAHALSDLQAEVAHLEVLAQQAAQARHDLAALRAEAKEAESLQREVESLRAKVRLGPAAGSARVWCWLGCPWHLHCVAMQTVSLCPYGCMCIVQS